MENKHENKYVLHFLPSPQLVPQKNKLRISSASNGAGEGASVVAGFNVVGGKEGLNVGLGEMVGFAVGKSLTLQSDKLAKQNMSSPGHSSLCVYYSIVFNCICKTKTQH